MLWGGAVVASQQYCANQCIDVASERKKQQDRTHGEQSASENKSERKKQDRWQAVKRFQKP